MPFSLRVVSVERSLFEGDVDFVVANGADGELGILPRHAPLMTILKPGALRIKPTEGEEQVLFVGKPRAQATPDRFRYPQLIAVTDLASAHAAIDEVIEQGEGARGDWRPAHYGRFFAIWNEYQKLRVQDPSFEPARPVMPAFTHQPYDLDQPQPQPTV